MATGMSDTNVLIGEMRDERLRTMSVSERAQVTVELSAASEALAVAGIQHRHPDADEREVALRLGVLRNGPELMRAHFGWDVDIEGY